MEFDYGKFEVVGQAAIQEGMKVVRAFQRSPSVALDATIKEEDETLVTACDRTAGKAILGVMKLVYPTDNFSIEDVVTEATDSDLIFLIDSLDGTRAFTLGLFHW